MEKNFFSASYQVALEFMLEQFLLDAQCDDFFFQTFNVQGTPCRNVVCVKYGVTNPDEIVVMGNASPVPLFSFFFINLFIL